MGLAKLRKEKGLSLHKLAAMSGVNYQKIYQIEKGTIKIEHIMFRTAKKLSDALGCTYEDLLAPNEDSQAETQNGKEGGANEDV